jgi:hypothetical protein
MNKTQLIVANELVGTYNENGSIAGFWLGLWQGLISPFTLIISFFNRDII